jgi:CRISPR/Cas system-associated protein Cas10 (large subunit of type III CRISPR-Cas system)
LNREKQPVSEAIQNAMLCNLHPQLEVLRYKLRENKVSPPETISLPSHPFMRPCDSCGIEHAEQRSERHGQSEFYCASCQAKQGEDKRIKRRIPATIKRIQENMKRPAHQRKMIRETPWDRILSHLMAIGYSLPSDTSELDRPGDFDEFRRFARSKEYLGLIYADANNMGMAIDKLPRLLDIYKVAHYIDESIHQAMSRAIKQHLPIKQDMSFFPFDILLLGDDDIVMVTDAAQAMEVAVTIAQEFHELAEKQREPDLITHPHTLSIAVVLAPTKYPFRLIWAIAQSALKFAKSEGAKARKRGEDETRINFLSVMGGSTNDFSKEFDATYHKKDKVDQYSNMHNNEFYATLRPYNIKDLKNLLAALHQVKEQPLGRTKLHQLRKVILDKNLTTSVTQGLKLLISWCPTERNVIAHLVFASGSSHLPVNNPRDLGTSFPRVIFPWFLYGQNDDKQNIYRTPLLDFIELYDFFVGREEEVNGTSK